MAILVIEQEIIRSAAFTARYENILAERDSGIFIPYCGTRSVVVEVLVLSVGKEEGGSDKCLRQSPCPLRCCVRALFQFSSVSLFHTIMIAQQGTAWYNLNVDLQKRLQKEKDMKLNQKIEISVFGALVISAAIWALAVATSRLVDSFVSEGAESGDWSIDEKEYGTN